MATGRLEDDIKLTPEAELVLTARDVMRAHAESHKCKQCVKNLEVLNNAVFEWLTSTLSETERKTLYDDKKAKEQIEKGEPEEKKGWDIFGK